MTKTAETRLAAALASSLFAAADPLPSYAVVRPHDGTEGTWVTKPDGSGYRLVTGPGHFKRALALAEELAGAFWEGYRAHERQEKPK